MADYYSQNFYGQNNQPYDQTAANSWFQQDGGWAQTNYNQQQYGDQSYNNYGGDQSNYGTQQSYSGNMFIPSVPQNAPQQSNDDFENEPPLLEELGVNFDHIRQKTIAVLNPIAYASEDVAADQDLAGPLVFCLLFGASLLLNGRVYFGYIYGIGMLGCVGMYLLLNLMAEQKSISFTCTASTYLGYVAALAVIAWCASSSAKLFSAILNMEGQKFLVAYPCAMRLFNTVEVSKKCTALIPKFESLIGHTNVVTSHGQCEQFNRDEGHFPHCTPDVVLRPNSTEEVSAILRLCNEEKVPVTASGTRTGIEGAAIPIHKGVVLDVLKMNQILAVNESDFDCELEPGITRLQLNEHIRDTGLFFSVDPGADASIGGMIATGASGTTSVRYGTMKSNVKNLEVVLADGRIIHTKGKSRRPWKSSAGLNLTELFIGSEGILGIITKAVVALHARPQSICAAVCPFQFLDENQMAACIKYSNLAMSADPTLFIEFHGATDDEVQKQAKTAKEICESNDGIDFKWSSEADRINELWKARHTAYYATLAQRPNSYGFSTDVCVPLSRLVEVVKQAQKEMENLSLKGTIVGHVGEGNFHCLFACSEVEVEEMRRIWEFSDKIVKIALAAGGTCTGEHGVGLGKRAYLREEFGEVTLKLMESLKRTLDPNGILNPGKIFLYPDAPAESVTSPVNNTTKFA
ncbi:FAD-binding PCMH-type domain-containing protein [Aphelenchoides besseyi]|nr:FAD-binding PCMH-type domain-containing protein [Aphelenchoides besseyi]